MITNEVSSSATLFGLSDFDRGAITKNVRRALTAVVIKPRLEKDILSSLCGNKFDINITLEYQSC